MNTKQLTAFAEGMMRETSTQTGEWVTVSRIALDEMSRESLDAIAALEAAERERDELRERLSLVREQRDAELNKNLQLEAELARRDGVEVEPVAWQYRYNDGKVGDWKTVDSEQECNHSPCYERRAIYTAAQPAVLLQSDIDRIVPAIDPDGLDEAKHYIEHALYVDRERIRSELKALGAQQQKVVELPETDWTFDDDLNPTFDADEVIAALDAAGVKWEVKK
ncbi:hypothetical protein PQB85_gp44 [Erwinia phage Midgardsormr38]|uniref:Ead/Ea22-like family protein n=1 Tax=Erwinia phage Midgardsormr38 TaxID=2663326 RepID=A0A5Q2F5R4_9CAUD|nr:hypothetical protein PQB85_gp44 [Erwinia phage Midgardsormr38]QGF22001.1 hypothetical protein [Erwinia phage Midgardsormr38]